MRSPSNPARAPHLSLRLKGLLVLIFPVLALAGAVAAVLWLERDMRPADELIARSIDLRAQTQAVDDLVSQADAAIRGWLASGDEQFLQPYELALTRLDPHLKQLAHTAGNVEVRAIHTSDIDLAARDHMALLGQLRQSGKNPDARQRLLSLDRASLGRFHARLGRLRTDGDQILVATRQRRTQRYQLFSWLAVLCGVAGPLGGLGLNVLLTARLARRVGLLAANAHRLATGKPLEELPGGSDEIAMLGRELRDAADLLEARQARLAESEERFRALFEQAPVPYHETGPDGIIQRVNQAECRLLGYDANGLAGRPAWEFVVSEERDEMQEQFLAAVRSGQAPPPVEREYVAADGSRMTLEIHENLIRGDSGEVLGMRVALLDVTEHRVAVMAARKVEQYARELRSKNEQLARTATSARAATEAKSRFLANISHELRTPLNGIIGFSELMYDGKVGPLSNDHREFLADILISARHLLQLINDILDISKIEAGRFEFRAEQCDLVRLAHDACAVMEPIAYQKQIAVRVQAADSIPAYLDPSRFKQILYNFVSNAVKFTPPEGQVDVRLAVREGHRVLLEVEDNGPGISAAEQSLLFREFEQLAASRQDSQGTGLGLALTKRLVEAQGGTVGVESILGSGSRFFAELPLTAVAAAIDVMPQPVRPRSILVVEDDPHHARTLSDVLVRAGYAVDTATTSAAAIAACQSRNFDGITLDVLLPDCSGWDLLNQIRATGLNRATPVIVVSETVEKGMEQLLPFQEWVGMPVRPADLLGALERAGSPPHRNRTVLVLDDDPATVRLAQATLTGLGYRTVCRPDSTSAMEALVHERPALILLDLETSRMEGFTFLDKLRGDGSVPHPPVIVWTNRDLSQSDRNRLEGSAHAILAKQDCTPTLLLEQLKVIGG